MIQALIIDNEKESQQLTKKLNESFPVINQIRHCTTVDQAQAILSTGEIDLVYFAALFDDSEHLSLLNSLDYANIQLILLSNHQRDAIKAIEYAASGYVVKPFNDHRLLTYTKRSIELIKRRNQFKRTERLLNNLSSSTPTKISIPFENEIVFVPTNEIYYCQGEKGYTTIVCKGATHTSSYSIGTFGKMLNNYGFISPHKSYLVNKSRITAYKKEGYIMMEGDRHIPVSSRKKKFFLEQLNVA